MKKERKQKQGEILCRITNEEHASFKSIGNTRHAIMDILTELKATERTLWDALREKYNLKGVEHMSVDPKGFVIRKIF